MYTKNKKLNAKKHENNALPRTTINFIYFFGTSTTFMTRYHAL